MICSIHDICCRHFDRIDNYDAAGYCRVSSLNHQAPGFRLSQNDIVDSLWLSDGNHCSRDYLCHETQNSLDPARVFPMDDPDPDYDNCGRIAGRGCIVSLNCDNCYRRLLGLSGQNEGGQDAASQTPGATFPLMVRNDKRYCIR